MFYLLKVLKIMFLKRHLFNNDQHYNDQTYNDQNYNNQHYNDQNYNDQNFYCCIFGAGIKIPISVVSKLRYVVWEPQFSSFTN